MTRRRRGVAWAATVVPAMARSLVRSGRAEAARTAALAARARRIGRDDLAQRLDETAHSAQASADTAAAAQLYWVTGDMARIAVDAAWDAPAVLATDAPAPVGLMVFAEPLPAWDTTATRGLALRDGQRTDIPHHDPVPVDALTWAIHHDTGARDVISVELHTRPHRLPHPLLANQGPLLVPFTTLTAALPAPLGQGGTVIAPTGMMPASDHVGVLALLEATWVLMTTPNLATTTPAQDPAPRGHDATSTHRQPADVTVIDIRPTRRTLLDPTPDTSGTGRRLTTRHVVRGHWTHQPHGPGRQLRRLQWVDDYLRGPTDAPITTRTHVWAWRH